MILKRFLIVSISILSLLPIKEASSCGGGDEPASPPSFFMSNLVQYAYLDKYQTVSDFTITNVIEWGDYFNKKINRKDISDLLYNTKIERIDSFVSYLEDKTFPISTNLLEKSIIKYKKHDKAINFLEYLSFAKECEPFATYKRYEWWDNDNSIDPLENVNKIDSLINIGINQIKINQNEFIKERYFFQVVRLYYLVGEYEKCNEFYLKYEKSFYNQNTIKYRIMGYVAGAMYHQKKYAEANYMYSVIFDKCDQMKGSAYWSFHPQEEEDWAKCISLAKTDHEKTVLWFLFSLYTHDSFRAMQKIYSINPKSIYLNDLLYLVITNEEPGFIRLNFEENFVGLNPKYLEKELLSFVEEVAKANNTKSPFFWNLTMGYLSIVTGEYAESDQYFEKSIKQSRKNPLVQKQIRALKFVRFIMQYEKEDSNIESLLYKEIRWVRKEFRFYEEGRGYYTNYVLEWAKTSLESKYSGWGNYIKSECLGKSILTNGSYDDELFYGMIEFMDKPNKTDFEKLILGFYYLTKSDFIEYEAVVLLYQRKFKEAISKFESCPGSGNTVLAGDPFIIHIKDCHDCDHEAPQEVKYTKLTFAKKMLELTQKIKSDSVNASEYYFLLGNGYYNMTYYGNARYLYETLIPLFSDESDEDEYVNSGPIFNCDLPKDCYKKAKELSNDIEFKAKSHFMITKCMQNNDYSLNINGRSYFDHLIDAYSNTNYYQEIIKECGYFRNYIGVSKPE